MAAYNELDINSKINLKAALRSWAAYSVDHFGDELDKKVYRTRLRKGSTPRSGNLRSRSNWWTSVGSVDRVMIQFLQYGRYVDMGVGRGVSDTDRKVTRLLREGSPGRRRKPWYSKRKSYEIKRLREVLAKMHVTIPVDAIENALSFSVNLSV